MDKTLIVGLRKVLFAAGVFVVITAGLYIGAIPRFEYLQDYVARILDAAVYVTGLYMLGNVGARLTDVIKTNNGNRDDGS